MNNSDRIGAGPDTKDLPRKGIFFVELRTHGVSGTPPEGILDADAKVVPFVGDKLANFWHRKRHSDAERYQRAGLTEWQAGDGDPTGDAPAVIIEGYRWGNLTAGSVKKAMWAFLFPFALTNLAAWMVPPVRQDADMSAWRPKLLGFVRSDNDQASRQKAGMSERQLRFVRHLRRFRLLKTVQLVRRLKNKDAGTRSGAPAGIIRMFGVLLTGLFVMQAVVILADLMAAQCISRNTDVCLNVPARLSWVRSTINHFAGHPLTLALIIGILVGVLVSLATLLTVVPGHRPEAAEAREPGAAGTPTDAREQAAAVTTISPKPGLGENSFVDGDDPRVPALRSLHALAAFAAPILLLSADDGIQDNWWWWTGFAMAMISVIGALFLGPGAGPVFTVYMWVFGGHRRGWVTLVVGITIWLVFIGSAMPDRLGNATSSTLIGGGGDWTLTFVLLSLTGCAVALLLSLLPFRIRRKYSSRSSGVPPAFRPWLYGTASVAVLGFTSMLGSGLGTGLAIITTNTLAEASEKDSDGKRLLVLKLPSAYETFGVFWGIVAVLVFVTLSAMLVVFVCRPSALLRKNLRMIAQRIQYGAELDSLVRPKPRIRAWVVGNAKSHGYLIIVGLVVFGVIALPISLSDSLLLHDDLPHQAVSTLKAVGVLLLIAFATFLFGAVYTASKKPKVHGRRLGILWDLVSFWPREAHPVVPGEYAPRAVNDIICRVRAYLAHDNARIILCGHSQGSVIMYAVVLQLIRTEPELLKRIGLITYGSPLQWAYTRGFPAMLSYESHKAVAEQLGGGWRNIIRATDPIGGPVLTWNQTAVVEDGVVRSMTANHLRQDTGNAPEEFTRLKRSSRNPGAHKVGSEYWITDPDLGDPTETTRGHSDYFHDPVWPRVVADTVKTLLAAPDSESSSKV